MKLAYLLALPLLVFANDWQPFVVDSRVSVTLPASPTELDVAKLAPTKKPDHTRLWKLQAPEGIYLVMRLPNGSTINRTDTAARRSFYAGVLTSILRNEGGHLLLATPFPTPAGAGIEYKYAGIHKGTGKRAVKYTRFLVADSVGYSLNFTPADRTDSLGLAGNEQRRHFFNSITVKP